MALGENPLWNALVVMTGVSPEWYGLEQIIHEI